MSTSLRRLRQTRRPNRRDEQGRRLHVGTDRLSLRRWDRVLAMTLPTQLPQDVFDALTQRANDLAKRIVQTTPLRDLATTPAFLPLIRNAIRDEFAEVALSTSVCRACFGKRSCLTCLGIFRDRE
jgi:hypothetical protein